MLIDNSVFYFNPTGYKSEKVYSVFPTNGDGDFSFDRNSFKTRVAKNGLVTEIGSDIPSISFDTISGVTNGCGHWQVESQSTNLITYSDDFSQWTTFNGAVVTDNFINSPDGTKNAAKVVYDGTTNGKIEIQIASSGTITQSIYLKVESGNQNVSIGTTSSDLLEVTLTDQWQRFEHTSSTGSYPRVLCNDAATIYVWGAQAEQKSYASSYISTSGSSVTRLAEGGFESDYSSSTTFPANTTTFVLWFSVKGKDGNFYDMIRFGDSSSGDYLRLEPVTASNYYNIYGDNITENGLINGYFEVQPNTICKLAVSYDTSEVKCYINGSSITLNATSGNLNIVDKIYNSTGNMNNINIHRLVVFNEKLSNSNLVTLTS